MSEIRNFKDLLAWQKSHKKSGKVIVQKFRRGDPLGRPNLAYENSA